LLEHAAEEAEMNHRSLVLALTVFAAGCGASPEQASEETYTLTVARVDAQGKVTTLQRSITASEQRAMNDARAGRAAAPTGDVGTTSEAISVDPSCNGADLWLYDGYGGTGNMICLAGEGTVWLQNIQSKCATGTCSWFARIRSYWPGIDNGWIGYEVSNWHPAYSCVTYFPSWGPRTDADSCVQRSDQLGTSALGR
jgi:hypothetical protein